MGRKGHPMGWRQEKAAALNFLYRNEIKSGKVLVDGAYVSAAAGLGVSAPVDNFGMGALCPDGKKGERTEAKVRAKTRAMAFIPAAVFFWRDYSWHGSWSLRYLLI